jgi:nucleoside-diphosphate-sugar epimerase
MTYHQTMRGNVYNCGDDEANMTKLGLCKRIAELTPFTYLEGMQATDPDKRDYVVSSAKLRATGWRPRVWFEDGLKELIEYFRIAGPMRSANV